MKNTTYHHFTNICTIILCLQVLLHANMNTDVQMHGFMFNDLGIIQTIIRKGKDKAKFNGLSLFSLNLKTHGIDKGKIEVLADIILPYGASARQFSHFTTGISDDRCSAMNEIFSIGSSPVLFDLRKMYFSIYLPFADIHAGRQIINFGKGVVFSPTDAFSSVELADLNLQRRGSDAISVNIPLGDVTGLDIIAELPSLKQNYSSALRFFTTVGAIDLSAVSIYKNKNSMDDELLCGLTIKGDAVLGLYAEAVSKWLLPDSKPSWEVMAGADYSIRNRLLLTTEYLYNQSDTKTIFKGEHNLFGSIRFIINDLTNISGNVIHDFQNEATLGTLMWHYNILQNVNLTAYIQGTSSDLVDLLMYSVRVAISF